jgi:threonine dehydrogenase-like Zn-dependent dehydrogenase
MRAIRFHFSLPRYAAGKLFARVKPSLLWSGLACVDMEDVPPPALPNGHWVHVRTLLGGICGSDLGTIYLQTSPYHEPFSSFPLTMGHESVGVIAEDGPVPAGWSAGERVVVEPLLWCRPRGFDDLCDNCARGAINLCQRVTEGDLAPGYFIGACADTGGSWSARFMAHESQLYRVPDSLSDANALMVEPFACGLHAVLQRVPSDEATVLILGAGTIGLCTLAALRAVGSRARVLISARHQQQAEAARRLGADTLISAEKLLERIAEETRAAIPKPTLGRPVLVGGVDHVFECVGSNRSLDDAVRTARPAGRVSLAGVPGMARGVDWSAIFMKELQIEAAYTYTRAEHWQGRRLSTFALTLEWMADGRLDLGWLVTHRFPLDEYDRALKMHTDRGRYPIIKAAFAFELEAQRTIG